MTNFTLPFSLSFIIFFALAVEGIGFRGFHFQGLRSPEIRVTCQLSEQYFEQPLNHFDVLDNRTWLMRYYENDEFYSNRGPIFIMLGGEWAISPGFLQAGLMFEIAKTHKAIMYYTEHRYYGKSRPVSNTESENLQYLNTEQALADISYFIEAKKKYLGKFEYSNVIVFGGSYAGNMAAWARLKYPHLIQGALASSAPVRAKSNFFEYYHVVTKSLRRYNKKCVRDVKIAFNSVEAMLSTQDGPKQLKDSFNLCDVPNLSVTNQIGWLMTSLAEIFAGTVQYNKIGEDGKTDIEKLCDKMTSTIIGTPFKRLASIVKKSHQCNDWSYTSFLNLYQNTSWDIESSPRMMRLWIYQTCTEYGYYQTSSKTSSIFGTLFPLQFFIQMCTDLYGNFYGANLLNERVERTNVMYGGLLPDVKNVVFSNGDIDPWHALSVLQDLNIHSKAILINGSSHVADLYQDIASDPDELKNARQQIRSIIAEWIK